MIQRYPKIETLYDRDPLTFRVDVRKIRKPEFRAVREWHMTEKIDGTNIRVGLHPDGPVEFGGKTDDAIIQKPLLKFLQEKLTPEVVNSAFDRVAELQPSMWLMQKGVIPAKELFPEVVIFGEGYGAGIQKRGDRYRPDVSFAVFDVLVGQWWLSRENVADVARKLGMEVVPELGVITELPISPSGIITILGDGDDESILARKHGKVHIAEGIVARTDPQMFFNNGKPLMWKLKFKDFIGKGEKK